jgi:hypothetical protein
MAQNVINVGNNANDGTGDTLREAGVKINANFAETYEFDPVKSDIRFDGNNITSQSSNADIDLVPSGTGNIVFPKVIFEDNNIKTTGNDNLGFVPNGTGSVIFGGLGFAGTSITAKDSSLVNINEALRVDGDASVTGTFGPTGAITTSGLTIDSNINITDNEIKATASNSDIVITAAGSGNIHLGAVKISGTTITSDDSSSININEGLIIDGTATIKNAVTLDSTLEVSSNVTITGNLIVSGSSTIPGTFSVDNLTFNDNIIGSSSNADINITPGGTGSVVISNITLDSNINITDNVIKATASNSDLILSGSGTGSVSISKIDMNEGTIDATIGATTGAAGTFTSLTFDPAAGGTLSTTGVTVTDNIITANASNDDLELRANGSGNVYINGLKLPNADGGTGQFLQTDGSKNFSFATVSIAFGQTSITDTETELAFRTNTEIDHVTAIGGHDLLVSAAGTADTWATTKYDSALYYSLHRDDISDEFEVAKHSVVHNNSSAFVSSYVLAKTGTNNHITVDTDIDSGNFRLRAQSLSTGSSMSYYRIGLGDNDSSGYTGEEEAAVVIDSEIAHVSETTVDHIIATGKSTLIGSSTVHTVNDFATTKYDSAWYLGIARNDATSDDFEVSKVSVAHNNSSAFASTYATTKTDNDGYPTFDADINSGNVRLRATGSGETSTYSFYRIGLGDNDSTGYSSGEQEASIRINTDVDSAVENLDTWAKADYRGAKYYISVNNSSKTEVQNLECLVVHDGSEAFVTTHGSVITGNNELINVTADIDSGNVRLRASGNEPNLRIHMYRILLADDEADRTGTNVNVIGEVTVSSSATTLDTFNTSTDDSATLVHGAHYIIVAWNASEGAGSICEASVVSDGSGAYVSQYAQTSTKGTDQITLTAAHDGSNTVTLSAASTSGGSTTVNAYRVNLTTPVSGTQDTIDSWAHGSYRGAKYFISMNDADGTLLQNREVLVVHDGSEAFMSDYGSVKTGTISTVSGDMVDLTVDISGSNVRLIGTVPAGTLNPVRIHMYRILLADNEADRSVSNNVSVTGDTTVSSTATTVDTFDSTDYQGAHYIVVANNSSEGAASICEAAIVCEGTNAFITQYGQTSTKSTGQITLTAVHDGSTTVSLKAASTSGGSTKVNVYGIKLTRGEGSGTVVATLDTNTASAIRSVKYLIQTVNSEESQYELIEANVTHDGSNAYISKYGKVSNVTDDLTTITADISGGELRLRGQISNVNTHMVNVVKRTMNV